jgi:transposase-like protein
MARTLLAEHDASGLSATEFARQHGLAADTLYRWRSKFKLEGVPQPRSTTDSLVNVTTSVSHATRSRPTLVLASGIRLEHPEMLSVDELKRVLSAC